VNEGAGGGEQRLAGGRGAQSDPSGRDGRPWRTLEIHLLFPDLGANIIPSFRCKSNFIP